MAPVTEVVPQTGTVIEGGNITLICNVSGDPSPSVVWTEVGSPVILSRKISLTVANVCSLLSSIEMNFPCII